MAFSAKAREARPRPHGSSKFIRLGRLMAQRSMSVLCLILASGVSTNRPLARLFYPEGEGDATDLYSAY